MSENDDLKKALTQTLEGIDKLIQRENHAAISTKIASDAAKRLEALEAQIKVSESKLNALNIEKDAFMAKANKEVSVLMATATEIQKAAEEKLVSAGRIEQQAQERLEEAKNALASHQNALNEVLSQKEKLRVALAG